LWKLHPWSIRILLPAAFSNGESAAQMPIEVRHKKREDEFVFLAK
jgi:hypothetical protein